MVIVPLVSWNNVSAKYSSVVTLLQSNLIIQMGNASVSLYCWRLNHESNSYSSRWTIPANHGMSSRRSYRSREVLTEWYQTRNFLQLGETSSPKGMYRKPWCLVQTFFSQVGNCEDWVPYVQHKRNYDFFCSRRNQPARTEWCDGALYFQCSFSNYEWNRSCSAKTNTSYPEGVIMLGDISVADEIYIVCGYTDMRRSIDGLYAIVQDWLHMDSRQRVLYLFCGKRCGRLKALFWEGDGFLLLYKRMEAHGRFAGQGTLRK